MKTILSRCPGVIAFAACVAWTASAAEPSTRAATGNASTRAARRVTTEPVTGSLLPARAERNGKPAPLPQTVSVYSQADIRRSGAASLGQFLGRATASGH